MTNESILMYKSEFPHTIKITKLSTSISKFYYCLLLLSNELDNANRITLLFIGLREEEKVHYCILQFFHHFGGTKGEKRRVFTLNLRGGEKMTHARVHTLNT